MKRIKPGMTAIVVLAGALVGGDAKAAPKSAVDCKELGGFAGALLVPHPISMSNFPTIPDLPKAMVKAAEAGDDGFKRIQIEHAAVIKARQATKEADASRHDYSESAEEENRREEAYDNALETQRSFERALDRSAIRKVVSQGCEAELASTLAVNDGKNLLMSVKVGEDLLRARDTRIRDLEGASRQALTALESCRGKDKAVAAAGSKNLQDLDAAIKALSEASSAKVAPPSKGDLQF